MNLFTGRQARPQASINSLKWLFFSCQILLTCSILSFSASANAAFSCDSVTTIPKTECESLVALYDSTNGDMWANTARRWKQTNNPCSWYGVTCRSRNGLGTVTYLNLTKNNLQGALPDLNLPNLEELYLSQNGLSGTIPNFNNLVNSLKSIDLSSNQLTGTIPDFDKFVALERVSFGFNKLTGNIPNFPKSMKGIALSSNQLDGSLPDFSEYRMLESLYIDDNQQLSLVNGVIPNFDLPKLRFLSLSGNKLNGTIPNFDKLPNLTALYLHNSQLIGSIPNFDQMTRLETLTLDQNQLKGDIPNLNLPNLSWFSLSENQLSGTIPDFDNSPSLRKLVVTNNLLNGNIPSSLNRLREFTLNNNCGLTAYDSAQEAILNQKDPNWKDRNPNCPSIITIIPGQGGTPGSGQTQPIITIIPGQGGTPGCGSSNTTRLVVKKQGNGEVVQTNMVCPGPVRKGSENCPVTNTTPYCGDEKINCSINDTQCSVSYIIDDGYPVVTLTATPAQGHTVNSWEGCDSVSENKLSCVVTTKRNSTEANTSVTVSFKELPPATFELKVEKTGNGSGTVSGSGSYTEGQRVELSAIPDTNSTFEGWSGDSCTSSFTMPTKDLTCSAKFDKCSYSVDSSSQSVGMNSETGSIRLSTKSGCSWNLSTDQSWVKITSDTTGKGETTIKYSIGANSDAISRSATISLNNTPLISLNQSAASCSYAIEPSTKSEVGETGETGNIRVIATPQCKWEVATDQSWLKINKVDSQSNVVSYQVDANTTLESRTGKISILANQKEQAALGISQKGESCTFKFDEASKNFSYQGGEQNVAVTASNAKCNWKTSSNVSWLKITSGTTGQGSGTVKYTVDANQTNQDRTAQVTIADKTFDVIQTATTCIFTDRPNAPKVTLAVKSDFAVLAWNAVENAEEYVLYYAPYPDPSEKDIQSFSLGKDLSISATLAAGTSIYVAVKAKNCVGDSGYSNIETILIPSKLPDAPDGYDTEVIPDGYEKVSKEEAWTQEKASTVMFSVDLPPQERVTALKNIVGVTNAICDTASCSITMTNGESMSFVKTESLVPKDVISPNDDISNRRAFRQKQSLPICPASQKALILLSSNKTFKPQKLDNGSIETGEYSPAYQDFIEGGIDYITSILKNDGYTVDVYKDEKATPEAFELLRQDYGVVLIDGHGSASGVIQTGEKFPCFWCSISKNRKNRSLYEKFRVEAGNFVGIKPSWWDGFNLNSKFIHFESCSLFYTSQIFSNSKLPEILLRNNIGIATGYVRNSKAIPHTEMSLFSALIEGGMPASMAYEKITTSQYFYTGWNDEVSKKYGSAHSVNIGILKLITRSPEYAANYYIDGDVCHVDKYTIQVKGEDGKAVDGVVVKITDQNNQEVVKAVQSSDLSTAVFDLSLDPTKSYVMTLSKEGYVTETVVLDKAALEKLAVQTTLYTLKKASLVTPPTLIATAGTESVSLSWNSVTGAQFYNVYRKAETETAYSLLKSNVSELKYDDTAVIAKKYCYKVNTNDNVKNVEGLPSNEVCATPLVKLVEKTNYDNWHVLRIFSEHSYVVSSVAFSPDGSKVLSGSWDNTLKLWDVGTGNVIRTFSVPRWPLSNRVYSVAFSPDGSKVLSGSYGNTLKLWDVGTGDVIHTFSGHSRYVSSVAFSPDGSKVLSGSYDNTLKLWDVGTGNVIHTFKHGTHDDSSLYAVYSVAFSPDGSKVLSGGYDNTLKLWDVGTGDVIHTFSGHSRSVSSVAFSPDGSKVLSGSWDHTLKLWDVGTGNLIHTFSGYGTWVMSVAFSPDGKKVLSGYHNNTLKLWDVGTGNAIHTFKHGTHDDSSLYAVYSVAFSPDGSKILSGGGDYTLILWGE
jgi:WD40 repeat protein